MTRSSGPLLAINLLLDVSLLSLICCWSPPNALPPYRSSLFTTHAYKSRAKTSSSSQGSECILFLYDSQLTAGSTFQRLDYNFHTLILQLFVVYNFSHSTQTHTFLDVLSTLWHFYCKGISTWPQNGQTRREEAWTSITTVLLDFLLQASCFRIEVVQE